MSYISVQFKKDIGDFATNLIDRADKIRELKRQIENLEMGINWVQSELKRLSEDKSRKRHCKHKEQLIYKLRYLEIQLAFTLHDFNLVPASLRTFYGVV